MTRHPSSSVLVTILGAVLAGFTGWGPAPAAPMAAAARARSTPASRSDSTLFVLLGTGNPNADPERSGPASAVVVGGHAYLIDAGPGIVRRAAAAARDRGVEALQPRNLRRVFVTHLHSDHTVGLPDLLFTPWVLDRPGRLEVYGPPGTARMMEHIVEAWREDIDMRVFGLEPREGNWDGYRPVTTEVEPGKVYEDARVRVTAIAVRHGSWPRAYAYRFETADRTIVVSGDTRPTDAIVEACGGCDLLVHEVYSAERFEGRPAEWKRYHASFHTSTRELAELAARARPRLLVLYHQLYWGATDEDLVREIRAAGYEGRVVSGRDLGVY